MENLFARGLWAVTRVDERYPANLRDTLKHQAPTVLFGAGEIHLLQRAGVAVVGSRNIDEAGAAFAREVGRKASLRSSRWFPAARAARIASRWMARSKLAALRSALLADSLEAPSARRRARASARRKLASAYALCADAGFSVGAAMGRNKLIYGLAEFAVVVSSDHQTGGTWAGAVEALKADWCPVLVRDGDGVPRGNHELLKLGATALPTDQLPEISDFAEWVQQHAQTRAADAELFDFALRDKPR